MISSKLKTVPDLPIQIHTSTLPHLNIIERAILDVLIQQGRAVIVPDETITEKSNGINQIVRSTGNDEGYHGSTALFS